MHPTLQYSNKIIKNTKFYYTYIKYNLSTY